MLAEFSRRQDQGSLLDVAFPKQRAFIEDTSTFKAAICTRRAGKSYAIGLYLIDEALKTPQCSVLYAALTRDTAKRTMVKDVIQPILKSRGIKATYNKVELSFTFRNGSVLYLLGLDQSEEEQEKLLGQKYRLAVIDECASFRQDLTTIVGKLRQAVASYRGSICLIGTPGDVLGYFHKVTTGAIKGWSVHRWTYHDNPYERDQQEEVRLQTLQDDPSYEETSEYKQFYLGEWAINESSLVYRYAASRNTADALPEDEEWTYALGVDLGFNDESAFVVVAYSAHRKELYVVESQKEPGLDFTATAQRIHQLIEVYSPFPIVVDGANKQGVEEMRVRHSLPLEPAEKTAKVDHIRLLNADLQAGRVKLLPLAEDLSKEWAELVWDERALQHGIRKEHPQKPNHLSDAMLYAWRRCFHYASRPKEQAAAAQSEAAVDAWWEEQERQLERSRGRGFWEEGTADPSDDDYLLL